MNRLFPTQFLCILLVFPACILLLSPLTAQSNEFRAPLRIDWQVFQGTWQRTDGNYRMQVEAVKTVGPVTVHYYNPSPVHVAVAYTFVKDAFQGLFIKLEDTGYQGSTYTLFYNKAEDVLTGYYFHAQLQQTFEVVFVRQ